MTQRIARPPNWADPIPLEGSDDPAHTASLVAWLLFLPGHSPAWSHYALAAVHLRPIDGVKPPHLDFPGAEYEIMLVALDPVTVPVGLCGSNYVQVGPKFLTPINISEQIAGVTDEQVVKLTDGLARALVHGVLPAEPDGLMGARQLWRDTIFHTLEHFQTGGHHRAPAGEA